MEQMGLAMFAYMTDLDTVEIDEERTFTVEATGHDVESLLFSFLDELLFHFSTEFTVPCLIRITDLQQPQQPQQQDGSAAGFSVQCTCKGEEFDLNKHPQGTEIKAITYHQMNIKQEPERTDLHVVLDI